MKTCPWISKFYCAAGMIAVLMLAGCQTLSPGVGQSVAGSASFQGPLKTIWSYAPEGANNGFIDWGPVVVGRRVFTPNGLNRVVALDIEDGNVVWDAVLASNIFGVIVSSDGSRLFTTTAITAKPSPTLYALNPVTGEVLWHNQANGQSALGGIESLPAVGGETVYVAYLRYEGYGGVCAFNANNGMRRWCYTREGLSPLGPLIIAQGRLYVSFDNHTLICLDANRGKLLWSFEGPEANLLAAPVIAGNQLLAAWGNSLYSLDAARGELNWAKPLEATIEMSSPKIDNGVLYVGSREGLLLAIQARDGSVLWRLDLQSGALNTSPVIDRATRTVWIGSASNELLGVSMEGGGVLARFSVAKDSSLGFWRNTPALSAGRLFIGSTNKNFYAIAPASASQ